MHNKTLAFDKGRKHSRKRPIGSERGGEENEKSKSHTKFNYGVSKNAIAVNKDINGIDYHQWYNQLPADGTLHA